VFSATVNVRGALDGFARLKKTDGRKIFRQAKKPMRDDIRAHSKDQEDESGRRWKPRAASTIARRGRRRGGSRGKLLGRLPSAFRLMSGPDYVRAVSKVKRWSKVHNEGGRGGKRARIPRRRFMYASKDLKRKVRDMWQIALKKSWEGSV